MKTGCRIGHWYLPKNHNRTDTIHCSNLHLSRVYLRFRSMNRNQMVRRGVAHRCTEARRRASWLKCWLWWKQQMCACVVSVQHWIHSKQSSKSSYATLLALNYVRRNCHELPYISPGFGQAYMSYTFIYGLVYHDIYYPDITYVKRLSLKCWRSAGLWDHDLPTAASPATSTRTLLSSSCSKFWESVVCELPPATSYNMYKCKYM